jgi:hypothetical protein
MSQFLGFYAVIAVCWMIASMVETLQMAGWYIARRTWRRDMTAGLLWPLVLIYRMLPSGEVG